MRTKVKNEQVKEAKIAESETVLPVDSKNDVDIESDVITEEREVEISPKAQKLLKLFKHLEYVYIDARGGVFDVATPSQVRGNAILYKNPFFNL